MPFWVDYLAPGSRQQRQHADAVPLYTDPGVLGADATSNTPVTLHAMPNERVDDIAHLLTSIEGLSKPALVTLAKDHDISGPSPYNLSSSSLRDFVSTHLTTGACALSSSEACIKLVRTFQSGVHSEESELCDQNITLLTLRIHVLCKIACTNKLRPLRALSSRQQQY